MLSLQCKSLYEHVVDCYSVCVFVCVGERLSILLYIILCVCVCTHAYLAEPVPPLESQIPYLLYTSEKFNSPYHF